MALESLILGVTYCGLGRMSDDLSTYFGIKKHGIEGEQNPILRHDMLDDGIKKSLFEHTMGGLLMYSLGGTLMYGVDKLIGIEDSTINVNQTLLYGIGTLSYMAAIGNTLSSHGKKRAASILHIPIALFNNTVFSLAEYILKIGDKLKKLSDTEE